MGTQFIFLKVNIQKPIFLSGTKWARTVFVPEWAKIKDPDVILSEVIKLENNKNITNEVGDPNDSDSMMEEEPELQEVGEEHERELHDEEEVVEVDIMMDKEDVVMEGDQLGNGEF